jgi:hypothetical protein
LHKILSGLKLKSVYYKNELFGNHIIDISSAKAVLRAQFEAFLMYHFIYVNPDYDDLKELRYNAWIYSSLIQRQAFPAKTEFGKQQKAKDSIEIARMKDLITNLKAFQTLTTKQQQSLLNTGSGKLFSHWATILKETGFSEQNPFYALYTFLTMYAHSEGLSIIQLSQQQDNHENEANQANFDLHHSKLLVCLMINSITSLYEVVKKKHETLPEQLKYDIKIYKEFAMRDKR